jgi:alkylation response protein AidB-like acyl-CoA dehydrogenase
MTVETKQGRPGLEARSRAIEAVQRLRPIIEHYREEAERERRMPSAVVSAMKDEGLFKLWLPREFGGEELDMPSYLEAIQELSRIDAAAGWTLANTGTGAIHAAFLPPAGAQEVFGHDELGCGAVTPNGRAIPVPGGYRISGRWPLVSGCHNASWFAGNCLVFDGQAPRMSPMGTPVFMLAFYKASDVQIIDTWYSTGMRGTGSADFAVEDVFVPAERAHLIFGAQSHVSGALYRLPLITLHFTASANICLGIARASIDAFVELARSKTPTMSQTPLSARPTVHAGVARAEATYQAARALMSEVARELMAAAESGGAVSDELEARRRLACVNAAEASERVVDAMYRLGGTTSIQAGGRLDRCLRDVHTINQHAAVSPAWWEKTGQFYFGQELGML